jgi:hypothetical protein
MKVSKALKIAGVCALVAGLGYLVKKVHDCEKDLKNMNFDDVDDFDFCEDDSCDELEVKEISNEEQCDYVAEDNDANKIVDEVEADVSVEEVAEEALSPELYDKVEKLKDLLTFEGLEFDEDQKRHLYEIVDFIKKQKDIRLALLLSMEFDGKTVFEAFTDNQFAEIKKIVK